MKAKYKDPHRVPKLQEPIENLMYDIHAGGIKRMLVEVTKAMVSKLKGDGN